jgi:hypothetical protein
MRQMVLRMPESGHRSTQESAEGGGAAMLRLTTKEGQEEYWTASSGSRSFTADLSAPQGEKTLYW